MKGIELTADRFEGRGKRLVTVFVQVLAKPDLEENELDE
jgi:hypothetical protein